MKIEYFLGFIIIFLLGTLFVFGFYISCWLPFKEMRDYIKMEMERSLEDEEYLYWENELKKLYINNIPILRSKVNKK